MPIHGDVSPELLHRYRVLIVPETQVKPNALVVFSRRLGPLEIHSGVENTLHSYPEIFCVGNIERDGLKASFSRGVEQWHADSSFRATLSDASLFYGEIVPPDGADTMFADATAAWRMQDKDLQRRVDGLYAVHSLETLGR